LLVACGILSREIRLIVSARAWPIRIRFLPSRLHVDIEKLGTALQSEVDLRDGGRLALGYGVCHPSIDRLGKAVVRMKAQNCISMLLGEEHFHREIEAGTYFLLEEWARDWTSITRSAFGDHPTSIAAIFRSEHKSILAIRTPCSGDFATAAQEVADGLGLPLRWIDVSLEHLESILLETLTALELGADAGRLRELGPASR